MDPRSWSQSYIASAQVRILKSPGFFSVLCITTRAFWPLRLTLNYICLWLFWAGGSIYKTFELLGSHHYKVQRMSAHGNTIDPSFIHLPVTVRVRCTSAVLSTLLAWVYLWQLLILKVRWGWRRKHRKFYRSLWRRPGVEKHHQMKKKEALKCAAVIGL